MDPLPTPHNNFFQFSLSHPPHARSLIESQLSQAALSTLNLDTLQLEQGSFVDADLRDKHSDLLFSANLTKSDSAGVDRSALVYLLFEHKSHSDPLTTLQLLSYLVRIWEQRVRDGQPLCPILPLVVYHGESGWSAARSITDLIGCPDELLEYQVNFHMNLLDLSELPDEAIPGERILRSTLQLLKYSRSRDLAEKLRAILGWIREAEPDDVLSDWIQAIGIYVISVNKTMDNQQYKQTLESILPTQFEVGSLADRLLTRGRAEGREEGLQEGMERGNLTGKIQVLSEMLGDPPVSVAELQKCNQAELEVMLKELQDRLHRR